MSWLFLLSSADVPASAPTPGLLARAGHEVTVVVTDDAVPPAVLDGAAGLQADGVQVLYDEAALRRRGLTGRVDPDAVRSHDDIAGLVLDPATRVVWR